MVSLISMYAIALPAQARSPIENGAKVRLLALRASCCSAVSGRGVPSSDSGPSQRSGLNSNGSGKYFGLCCRLYWLTATCVPGGMTCPSTMKGSPAAAEELSCSRQVGVRLDGDIRIVSSMTARRYVQLLSFGPARISLAEANVVLISLASRA